MASPTTPRLVTPCPICGGQCKAFPDIDVHPAYPFLSAADKEAAKPPKDPPKRRPKGKRRPVEDRARHLSEDR